MYMAKLSSSNRNSAAFKTEEGAITFIMKEWIRLNGDVSVGKLDRFFKDLYTLMDTHGLKNIGFYYRTL